MSDQMSDVWVQVSRDWPRFSEKFPQEQFTTCFSGLMRYSLRSEFVDGEVAEWPKAPLC